MIGFTLACVAIRTYIRKRKSGFYVDWTDFFVACAWLSFLAQGVMDTFLDKMGFFNPGIDIWDAASDVAQVKALKVRNSLPLYRRWLKKLENIRAKHCSHVMGN